MSLARITTVDELHRHLYAAMQLEHATLPPYLTALYSIHPGTNTDAYHVIRAVAVEEMLHLTLAANLMNAVGGTPRLTQPGFMPPYPTALPDGETDFEVGLRPFSRETVDTFLKIERPARPADPSKRIVRRKRKKGVLPAAHPTDTDLHFYSIGEFYEDIAQGFEHLQSELGADRLFTGDPKRQITPDYYYSGGGEVIPVSDLKSARAAIRLIAEQGEGVGGGIFDYEGEISHYYRFEQLVLGRYYQKGDKPGRPSGGSVEVDWNAVFPVKANARLADYTKGSELHAAAAAFNGYYGEFLDLLTQAFCGQRERLIEAVGEMFRIKELAYQLMRNPVDGLDGVNGAPTFELAPTAKGA